MTAAISRAGTVSSPDLGTLEAMRAHEHPRCVVCGPGHSLGLQQKYTVLPDGQVEGTLKGNEMLQGYTGLLHGGVAAALLDGAMTNCLFAYGVQALTAELSVRYQEPILIRGVVTTRARLVESRGRLQVLCAELIQDGRIKATAKAKFMRVDE